MNITGKTRFLMLVSYLIVGPVHAAMRCDRSWVDVGASVYDVLSKCGDPSFQQLVREPVIAVSNAHVHTSQSRQDFQSVEYDSDIWTQEPRYQLIERWTYNPGSGRLLQELDFFNGEVIRMRTGSRVP